MIHCYYIAITRIRSKAPQDRKSTPEHRLEYGPRIERRSKDREEKLPNKDTNAKRLAGTCSQLH